MKKVVFINKFKRTRNLIERGLAYLGYRSVSFATYNDAKIYLQDNPDCYAVILTDNGLPADIENVSCIRAADKDLTILFITRLQKENELVAFRGGRGTGALNAGADRILEHIDIKLIDGYLKALSRRVDDALLNRGERLRFRTESPAGDVVLDTGSRQMVVGGTTHALTAKEYELLYYMMSNPNQVLPRQMIMSRIWGDGDVKANTLEVYVRYLRQKTEKNGGARVIQTHRGVGYMMGLSR